MNRSVSFRMLIIVAILATIEPVMTLSKTFHSNPTTTSWQLSSKTTSTNRCAAGLPRGCSCSKNDGFASITCSAVGLTGVPKNWVDAGNSLVKTLNLECNNISEVNIGDFFGVKIERLLLGNNSIHELNFLSFWGLEYSLETLDLSYNRFRRVPFEALRLLRNLRSLGLTGNEITALRDFDFGYMRKLEVLALDKNPITVIDTHAFVGTRLSLLNFDRIRLANDIADLPTADLGFVRGLSLAHNGITSIPNKWFLNFKSLSYLSLDSNQLTSLHSDTFEGLENTLKILEINHNGLTDVPTEALQRLAVLESLEISNNRIRRVHRRAFNSSSALQTLNLSHNRLNKLSKRAFVGLDAIQKIDLRHNRLITLDDTTFAGLRSNSKGRIAVYIADNPWLCNCIIKWVKEEFVKRTKLSESRAFPQQQQQEYSLFVDDPVCDRPKFLHGQKIPEVQLDDFTCDHDYYYYYYDGESNDVNGESDSPEHFEEDFDSHPSVDDSGDVEDDF